MFGIGNIFYLPDRHPNRLVSTNVETSFLAFVIASCAANTYLAAFFACNSEKTSANAGFAWIMVGFERALSCLI